MDSAFLMAILFAGCAGVLSAVLTMFGRKNKKPIWAFLFSLLMTFFISLVGIWFFNPDFSFMLNSGWFIGFTIVLLITALSTIMFGGFEKRNSWDEPMPAILPVGITFLLAAGLIFVRFIVMPLTNPPGLWSDEGQRQIYSLLQLKDAEPGQTAPDLDINMAQRVSPGHAKQKALNALPREGSIGSYLTVGEPYLQGIRLNGSQTPHPYYVFSMTVTDGWAYNNSGGEIPGFIIVDAADKDAPARWIALESGHGIRYVQGAGFLSKWDLDRYVYQAFSLPNQIRVEELDGMEVDDELNPWYTASIMSPVAGYDNYYPTGMIIVNPNTGEIKRYTLDEIPDWVDRKLPISTADRLINAWAGYANHKISFLVDTNQGKKKIDEESEVWSPDGLLIQYVLTANTDNSTVASDLIYVNPRTMEAVRYDMQGVVQSRVAETIKAKAKSQYVVDMDVSILQIEWIAGRQVWYGVLEKDQKYWGVALVQTSFAVSADTNGYIIDPDLQTAVQRLRIQIATGSNSDGITNIPDTTVTVQLEGVIDRLGSNTMSSDGQTWYGNFILRTTYEGRQILVICRYPASDIKYAFLHEGDSVTVTLLSVNTDGINDVITVDNHTYQVNFQTAQPN